METYEDKNFNIRLEVRVKNAELIRARESLGLNQRQAAELIGIHQINLSNYELLKTYPLQETQERICGAYRKAGYFLIEEDAFPERLRNVKLKGKFIAEREIPIENLLPLSSISERLIPSVEPEAVGKIYQEQMQSAVKDILFELDERKRTAIMMYFGINQDREYTCEEIAKHLGVCHGRVNQLINDSLVKLRHPKRRKKLLPFVED
ncbi:MAG: sigma factor-like helix-turn-helix DNA-binding protein [Candidatus Pacearchaeota archaeon]